MKSRKQLSKEEKRMYGQLERLMVPDRPRKRTLKWARSNVDRMKKWADGHKDICRASAKRWRAKNKERFKEMIASWQQRNPGRSHERQVKRRAMIYGSRIGSERKAVHQVYDRAKELRQWFDVVVDHIVPLCAGGAHCVSNLQIIYRSENQDKGKRMDYVPAVVFQ